jgi:hypothetical protein
LPARTVYQKQATVFGVASKGGLMGVEGAIVYEIGCNDFIFYFNNPYSGLNWHTVRIFGGVQSAQTRYNQLKNIGVSANQQSKYANGPWYAESLRSSGNNAGARATYVYTAPAPAPATPKLAVQQNFDTNNSARCPQMNKYIGKNNGKLVFGINLGNTCRNITWGKLANGVVRIGAICRNNNGQEISSYIDVTAFYDCV